ncbi:MAG TPA: hypothetical protein VK577_20945 [Bradyrhizobium sp.]|nr:hypothetical protein [Bradyrhizobium sp.]
MSQFWKIEEAVGGGLYIELDGIFETEEACKAAIARHKHNEDMRAVQYQTGGWSGGPVRVVGYYR